MFPIKGLNEKQWGGAWNLNHFFSDDECTTSQIAYHGVYGTWFIETLSENKTYVRYFLRTEFNELAVSPQIIATSAGKATRAIFNNIFAEARERQK